MKNITRKSTFAAGTALALGLSGTALASVEANAFSIQEFGGLRIAEAGQGQCGGNKPAAEAKCGAEKTAAEANCGAKKKAAEAKCGSDKAKPAVREATCGEAKCGATK